MSVDDAAWVRAAAQRILARRGVEVSVVDDGAELLASDGMRFTLDTVAATCRVSPRSDWTGIVERHFGAIARARESPGVDALEPDELLRRVRTRLVPVDALTMGDMDMRGYARPVADDLAAVLCIDLPETVAYIDDSRAAQLDVNALFAAGMRNTDAEPVDTVQRANDGALAFLSGESVFVASKVLNMAGLATAVFAADCPHGVVFAAPDRNVAVLYRLTAHEPVEAITQVAQIAARTYHDAVWPVSPNAYFWYCDRIERVSHLDAGADSIGIHPGDALTGVLSHLADMGGQS